MTFYEPIQNIKEYKNYIVSNKGFVCRNDKSKTSLYFGYTKYKEYFEDLGYKTGTKTFRMSKKYKPIRIYTDKLENQIEHMNGRYIFQKRSDELKIRKDHTKIQLTIKFNDDGRKFIPMKLNLPFKLKEIKFNSIDIDDIKGYMFRICKWFKYNIYAKYN